MINEISTIVNITQNANMSMSSNTKPTKSFVFGYCQAQFQLASQMTSWTEISFKFDYYHPHPHPGK